MPWITQTTLEGTAVRLEPLSPNHADGLLAAAQSEDTFKYFPRYPQPWTIEGFRSFVNFLNEEPDRVAFCVIERATNRPIGATTFFEIRPVHKTCEIGWTWLAASHRGQRANPEMKRLMLAHAFDNCGAMRVQLRTDLRNLQSQHAIEKLGAQKEGVFRENIVMMDGYRRSTVFYSILAREWPTVRDKLDARLMTM